MNNKNNTGKPVKFLERAKALIFIDNNKKLYDAIKNDERLNIKKRPSDNEDKNQVTYLHNPLPVPKKKAHKKLDYEYNKSEVDDWDIDITDSNLFDYDV